MNEARVVLDTGVVVSAALFPQSIPRQAVESAAQWGSPCEIVRMSQGRLRPFLCVISRVIRRSPTYGEARSRAFSLLLMAKANSARRPVNGSDLQLDYASHLDVNVGAIIAAREGS